MGWGVVLHRTMRWSLTPIHTLPGIEKNMESRPTMTSSPDQTKSQSFQIPTCWKSRPDLNLSTLILGRFAKKITYGPDCWDWNAALYDTGYGVLNVGGGRLISAHRLSVFFSGRDIPVGMQTDHLCRRRNCVNPSHLEIVTPRENGLRSTNFAALNHKKSSCLHGHPFDEKNTYHRKSRYGYTTRQCKECIRTRKREAGRLESKYFYKIITCKFCGILCSGRKERKFCSIRCSLKSSHASYKKRHGISPAPIREIACATCGTHFFAKAKNRRFCTSLCLIRDGIKKYSSTTLHVCIGCGSAFGSRKIQKFCNHGCYMSSRKRHN